MVTRLLAIVGLFTICLVMAIFFSSCQTKSDKGLSDKQRERALAPTREPGFIWPDLEIWPRIPNKGQQEEIPSQPLPPEEIQPSADIPGATVFANPILPPGEEVVDHRQWLRAKAPQPSGAFLYIINNVVHNILFFVKNKISRPGLARFAW